MELSAMGRAAANGVSAWKQNAPDSASSSAPNGARNSGLPADVTGAMPPVQEKGSSGKNGAAGSAADKAGTGACQTCQNRKYQDGSDDPGVSFKSPTKVDPSTAASAVRGHEMEHVTREQFDAMQEGRKVVSQTVTMHNAICPECGRVYVSGGTTRTVTRGQEAQLFQAGTPTPGVGQQLDEAG